MKTLQRTTSAILLTILGLMLIVKPAEAQESRDMAKYANQFSVSVSDNSALYTAMSLGGIIGTMFTAPFGTELGDIYDYGAYTLSYSHSLGKRFRIGGDITYAATYMNFKNEEGAIQSSATMHFPMIMVSGRCDYVRKKNFIFYGDAALGAMACIGDGATFSPAFQIDPLGFRFGRQVAGFLEVGFGMRGILTAGLEVSF